jgi:hypothetical protein
MYESSPTGPSLSPNQNLSNPDAASTHFKAVLEHSFCFWPLTISSSDLNFLSKVRDRDAGFLFPLSSLLLYTVMDIDLPSLQFNEPLVGSRVLKVDVLTQQLEVRLLNDSSPRPFLTFVSYQFD